ncbi:unnamed protein product [Knipowitschia caucasica]|uniref:Uncharacterized protein n=1 Tax=Knipowitschia caucasica TaxID=637954 RepID=A0AAV2KFE8_KNICA
MSKIPTGLPPQKKTGRKVEDDKDDVPRKNVVSKPVKGFSTRHSVEAELKEQNQNLRATNEELQKHITHTQHTVTELQQQNNHLQEEKMKAEKQLRECHVLLVSAHIDPVLGEREAAHHAEEQRKEVMSASTDLLQNLKTFSDFSSEQCCQLQDIQGPLCALTTAQQQMEQESVSFALEAAQLEQALIEAEALLL